MQRHLIGVIAVVLLAGSAGLYVWRTTSPVSGDDWRYALMGATIRVGLVMAVVWLAYHELKRLPAWVWAALPVLLALLAIRPRYLLIAVPIVIALALLKPRAGRRR